MQKNPWPEMQYGNHGKQYWDLIRREIVVGGVVYAGELQLLSYKINSQPSLGLAMTLLWSLHQTSRKCHWDDLREAF